MANDNNKELGFSGLAEFSGQIHADFLREWRGIEAYKRANEMRLNSPIAGALLLAIELSIRGVDWPFASDQGEEDPRLQLLNDARENMSLSWNDHITEALTFLPFGFSIFEEVYEQVGGRWLWRKFAPRGQDTVNRWLFDETGGLAGFEQLAAPKYQRVTLPIEKLLIYRTRVERGNPEGRSILRTAWIPYYFCKHIQQVEAIGLERGMDGFPVITMPPGATTDESDANSDASKAAKIVRNIRNDEQAGGVMPDGWKLDLFAPGSQSRLDPDKVIRRHESRMLMSVLSQFLMLGQEGVGSLALSRDQTDFFNMSVNAVADIIAQTFTKYAVPRLLRLNGYDAEGVRMEHTPAGDIDLTKVTDMLQRAGSFFTWGAEDEAWLREVSGLPEADVEELEAERAARKAASDAALAALSKAGATKEEGEEDGPAKLTVFAANPPDDAVRLRFEKRLRKALAGFQAKQQKRILKAAKEMKRA